jgi:hypothetical protein
MRERRRHIVASLAVLSLALALSAPPASASFHLISSRDLYTGFAANPAVEYVELQMYADGQQFVQGHSIRTYDAAGVLRQANTFPADVLRGSNQSTIVMATPEAEAAFNMAADAVLSPSDQLSPTGGAVCWDFLDCVAWGNFNGSLPSPTGAPAVPGGIAAEMALRRTIAPGCPTLLEAGDDRDDSATDFSAVFPAPRPNAVAPSEHACSSASPGTLPGPGPAGPPQTRLRRKPPRRTKDRTPTFGFASDETLVSFQCRLDHRPFKGCRSPLTVRKLSMGRHTFMVRARDSSGALDPSPAAYAFRVVPR